MKVKRSLTALLLTFVFAAVYSFNADDDFISKVGRRLDEWRENNPIEKVHLHFDKPYYTAGDDIWFKAYVTIGAQHQLSAYSGILNVELIDEQDSVKQSLKLQLEGGIAWGDFALPDTMHEGNYRLRAYTQYMLNAGNDYIFDRAISIGNVITNKVFTKTDFDYEEQSGHKQINANINYADVNGVAYAGKAVTYALMFNNEVKAKGKGVTDDGGNLKVVFTVDDKKILKSGTIITAIAGTSQGTVYKNIPIRLMAAGADMQIFPEGGNLLNGVPAKVAFKAIGTDGLGIDLSGTVIDDAGNKVAPINTMHLGMGVFEFTPRSGVSYKADVTYPDGSKGTVPLPAALDNGYVLRVFEAGPQNIRVTIVAAKGTAGDVNLVGQSAGKVRYIAKSVAGKGVFTAVIPKSKFPSGITQFTLFSAGGDPLNERLVFIQNSADKLNIAVASSKESYAPRENVALNISATDNKGMPALSSLSVSVTDETRVPVNDNLENNILANLLLTSDLKGYVEQPAYYFNNVNDKTKADLDALMLTQGYRRFEWKNVLNETQTHSEFGRESAFTISGRVTTRAGKPVVNGKVQLINYQDGILKIDTVTDHDGRFVFNDMLYADSANFIISARTANNKKNVVIKMDTVVTPVAAQYKAVADFYLNTTAPITAYAQTSKLLHAEQVKAGLAKHAIKLKEVTIKEKFNPIKHSANINPNLNDQVLTGSELGNGCAVFIDCLKGKLMGVMFIGFKPFSARNGKQMELILDGMAIPDPENLLKELNGNDIQSIEVIRGAKAAFFGGLAGNGAIFITTKRGDEALFGLKSARAETGVVRYKPKGVYIARSFYSPKYDAQTNEKIADLRTTVFWDPAVTTANGKALVTFANAGGKGTYRVVIEGINSDGNIGRRIFRYKVE